MQIYLSKDIIQPYKQSNDSLITEEVIESRLLVYQRVLINRVRLSLGVLFILDLIVPG
jgi:hypothetical protein